ncbi:MAG TPA: CarD family transcriptional regulator [Anaerolineales bacterium]|nr:CarD family transcriptional regulator [Anaerolineales bacterium]
MNFNTGDTVMHWTYGIGQIVNLEERDLFGSKTLYYAVQVRDMTVWVPADDKVSSRLRSPASRSRFKQMLGILSGPCEPLPEDRLERKNHLLELLKDSRPESLCQVVRDLSAYQKQLGKPMNDNDQMILKQSRNTLLGEWGFVLSITRAQAELELHRLLTPGPQEIAA